MKPAVTIYQDEDGVYIAECPSIPGCVSQGRSEEEAEKNVRQASRHFWCSEAYSASIAKECKNHL